MLYNLVLQEAVEATAAMKTDDIVSSIKKTMNVCKLTKYKSVDKCAEFFSAFFLCSVPNMVNPTVEQWGSIYTTLLSNDAFCGDLAIYMVMYHPTVYTGIFAPLWGLAQSELAQMKENKIRYLSQVKALFTMLQVRLNGVTNIIKSQVNDVESLKFASIVDQVLNQYIMDLSALTQAELEKAVKASDVKNYTDPLKQPMDEDSIELIKLLEDGDSWMLTRQNELLNEAIVRKAVEKAKEAKVASDKAGREFNEIIMKKVKEIRENRRNKKHSEMVGESLRINREIARILKSCAWGLLNPMFGVIRFVVSVVYERATDRRDREVLINQLKDELEIVEEKIQMAERNGDEKARIELIRFRQKLEHEYERITRLRWDASTRSRMKG